VTAVYDGAADRWAAGASLVYGPLAHELVRRSPHPLAGRLVLDVGAGTGVGSDALRAVGARPVGLDLSLDMLSWRRPHRPPAVVASVDRPPIAPRAVDDVFASFVLNHVPHPVAAMRGLAATVRPGGAFLATVYATASTSPVRERIDEVARARGWVPPDWYTALKAEVVPLLGSRSAMQAAADDAGLVVGEVAEEPMDVGVTTPEQMVDYRFGQAHVSAWLTAIGPEAAAEVRDEAIAAIAPVMVPYRPVVVLLSATVGA
jgi:ubiquinone/menaquinone biosynthesis C-methylase UbiE